MTKEKQAILRMEKFVEDLKAILGEKKLIEDRKPILTVLNIMMKGGK